MVSLFPILATKGYFGRLSCFSSSVFFFLFRQALSWEELLFGGTPFPFPRSPFIWQRLFGTRVFESLFGSGTPRTSLRTLRLLVPYHRGGAGEHFCVLFPLQGTVSICCLGSEHFDHLGICTSTDLLFLLSLDVFCFNPPSFPRPQGLFLFSPT